MKKHGAGKDKKKPAKEAPTPQTWEEYMEGNGRTCIAAETTPAAQTRVRRRLRANEKVQKGGRFTFAWS